MFSPPTAYTDRLHMIIIGIDPGPRYTGVSVRNIISDEILHSATFVREGEEPLFAWGLELYSLIKEEVLDVYGETAAGIGVEGVSAPKGFKGGKAAPLNPKHIIHTGIIAGILVAKLEADGYPRIVIIPPGKNGNRASGYPDILNGRRPKDLPGRSKGAGTRNHERSAYDVAGEVRMKVKEGYSYDKKIPKNESPKP